jgi:hypothetical protein
MAASSAVGRQYLDLGFIAHLLCETLLVFALGAPPRHEFHRFNRQLQQVIQRAGTPRSVFFRAVGANLIVKLFDIRGHLGTIDRSAEID